MLRDLFRHDKMTLFCLMDYLELEANKSKNAGIARLLNTIKNNISIRIETRDFASLYSNEMKTIYGYVKQYPGVEKFKKIYDTLKEAYIRYLSGQFKYTAPFRMQGIVIRNYLEIIEFIECMNKDQLYTFNYYNRLKSDILIRIETISERYVHEDVDYVTKLYNDACNDPNLHGEMHNKIMLNLKSSLDNVKYFDATRDDGIYQKYQDKKYKIQNINQDYYPEIAAHPGFCLGIAMSVAIPEMNPYSEINKNKSFCISKEMARYSVNQPFASEMENENVRRIRLTREHSCLDRTKQAKEILSIAKKYSPRNLIIHLYGHGSAAHVCYINFTSNNEIKYLDAHYGAYLFYQENEFLQFYNCANKLSAFVRYSVSAIEYVQDSKVDLRTYSGKMRSFLTGPKYLSPSYELSMLVFHMGLGLLLGSSVTNNTGIILLMVAGVAFMYLNARYVYNYHGALALPRFFKNDFQYSPELIHEQDSNTIKLKK